MFSLFNKTDEEIAVVFDIGSGSIGAALVKFSSHGIPNVLFNHREPLTFQQHVSSHRLLGSMTKLLKGVADHVQKEGLSHLHRTLLGAPTIKHVFCIFTSPWYVSQTKAMTISKDKPFLITKNSIKDILAKQEEELLKELADGKYEKQFGTSLKILERKVIHTKLNGYEVQDPVGKRAKDLEITFFVSFISKDVSDAVEDVLRKSFHFKKLESYSSALSLTTAIRDAFPSDQSFLIVDITGEVTDVSFISKGVLLETSSFPLGRSMLVRSVVDGLVVPPEVALSYLVMQASESTEATFAEKVGVIVEKAGSEWKKSLSSTFLDLAKRYQLPKTIFMVSDADLGSFFLKMLQKPFDISLNLPQDSFQVIPINLDQIKHFAESAPKVQLDPPLALHSIFLNNIVL